MRYEKKRLSQDEQIAFLEVAGLLHILHGDAPEVLDPMLKLIPGGRRDIKMMRTKVKNLFDSLCDVTPQSTLQAIYPTLKRIKCRIGVPLIGKENVDEQTGWVISFDDLRVLTSACYDKCMLCDRNGADIGKCELRKTLKRLPTPDEPEPMGGGCGYKRLIMADGDSV